MKDHLPKTRSGLVCPTCRKPADHAHRPFCSKRCADIDLARWLGGRFVIPGSSLDVADESGGEALDGASGPQRDTGQQTD